MISNLLMAAGKQAPISTVDLVDPFGGNSGVALYKIDGDATDESAVGAENGAEETPAGVDTEKAE